MSELSAIPQRHVQEILSDTLFYRGILQVARHFRSNRCLGGLSIHHTGGKHGNFAQMQLFTPTTEQENDGEDPHEVLSFDSRLLMPQPGTPVDSTLWTPLLVLSNTQKTFLGTGGEVQLDLDVERTRYYAERLWPRNRHAILGSATLFGEIEDGSVYLGLMKAGPQFDKDGLLGALGHVQNSDDMLTAAWLNDLRYTQIRYRPGEQPRPEHVERTAALYAPADQL